MRKVTESQWKLRSLVIQYFFDLGYNRYDLLEVYNIKQGWIDFCKKNYEIVEHYHCRYCKTKDNLNYGKMKTNVCLACRKKRRLGNLPKKYKSCVKNCYICKKEVSLKKKYKNKIYCIDCFENIKKCKVCGTKKDLFSFKNNKDSKRYKKNICKICYSEKKSKDSKKIWEKYTQEEKESLSRKRVKNWKKSWNKKSKEEIKEFKKKVSEGVRSFYNNLTEEEKNEYIEVRRKCNSKIDRKELGKKISKAWKNKSKDEIKERSKKIYETKLKNETLNKRPYGFGHKAQELFWCLDDNINKTPIYATMKTRDIKNRQNDEQLINVRSVSKTKKARRLDFYLKFEKYLLLIEFDEKAHSKKYKNDLVREQELTCLLPNLIILRVREKDYFNNKEKVEKDLLSLINLIERNIFNWNIVPIYLRPLCCNTLETDRLGVINSIKFFIPQMRQKIKKQLGLTKK